MEIRTVIFLCALVLLNLGGCSKKEGAMERAGERADEVVDNVKDGDPLFHKKGPVEKMGENIDQAAHDLSGDGK